MIGIRADANDKIAMGHLMRCISIAVRLKELGQDVLFIMSQPYGVDFLNDKGLEYVSLGNDYDDKHSEVADLIKVIEENNIDKLLIDSYQVDAFYMSRVKECGVKLIYMDDMLLERYPVDALVNYTIGIENGGYDGFEYTDVKLLLGADYIPLRPEFSEESIEIKDKVENVFITTGGTDEFGMIVALTETLSSEAFRHLRKTIVVGKFFKDDEKIAELAAEYGNIDFHKDVKDICSIMKTSDVAISAGGTTLAELSACGIPTICFSVADNQLGGVKAYSDNKVMYYAGDVREDKMNVQLRIRGMLMKLMHRKELREEYARNARTIVDGKGAVRIAKAITEL